MNSPFTKSRTTLLGISQLVVILLLSFSNAFGAIALTVNGQANGASFAQGSPFSWNISGIANGSTVSNELWIDLNANGAIDVATDLLFVSFSEQDGVSGGDRGPGDDDGLANGVITTNLPGIYFPAANYIFKTKSGTDSATSTYTMTAMATSTFSVSGKVTRNAIGVANVTVTVQSGSGEFYALTNAVGNYTIATNLPSGTAAKVRVPFEGFNSLITGNIASPNETALTLTANVSNIDFTLQPGKIVTGIVTDTLGNPIADMRVSIYPTTGGNSFDSRTDGSGKYFISVDTGTYIVQFGSDQEPKGYLKTYYNQKYLGWATDNIHISPSTDTLKNINAVLRRGGLIMGTFIKNGVPISGNITAFAYNAPDSGLYETWHESTANYYYLFVPPGTYSIQFTLDNNMQQAYYNQSIFWPGTAVTINSFSDTAKNINVDFSSLPKAYTFIGSGNWNNSSNWTNNIMPPTTLPTGDYIIISPNQGGQCILNITQTLSSGANLIVRPGSNFVVPGQLLMQ